MKIKMLALVACLFMPFQLATADIAADFKSGMPMDQIMTMAVKDGMSIEDAVAEMITVHPELTGLIVTEAVKRYPSLVREIVVAATTAAPKFKDTIASAAIAAGGDKAAVAAATAAAITGGKPPSKKKVVATTPVPFPGGGASPN